MDPEKDYPVKPTVVDKDADDALKFIVEGEVISMSPEEERKLVRKIDFMILPLLCTGQTNATFRRWMTNRQYHSRVLLFTILGQNFE